MTQIQNFLYVKPNQLASPLKKQNKEDLSDLIENYIEFKNEFTIEQWQSFFR